MTLQHTLSPGHTAIPDRTFQNPDIKHNSMSSLLLRVFIRIGSDGVPTMDVAAPYEALHYLFPQTPHPGFDPCPFTIQLVPKDKQQLFSDLSSVLNTRQLKPNEDHYRIMPSRERMLELIAQQREVYPPPSTHPTHLRRDRSRTVDDPELDALPGYRQIWIYPADVSRYLVSMGYRYMGSHPEACDPHAGHQNIWDVHTFVASGKLQAFFTMMATPHNEMHTETTVGTPRNGSRVTFQDEQSIKSPYQ